ncbi:cytochrome c oxidase subunit 4 isoform 1, mitochondrial-like isoform X2 [Rhynchophorus ferrugineus]|uniref:Cytochrome c oxidase subunit 4 n=1 Tax=Rhynchophorus ferrugineus TaxID=354439 RepID=A0A834MJN2_RHYFE|nr:hypothetical protein GWI33_017392 [Rhynchophorus ferrugineus]
MSLRQSTKVLNNIRRYMGYFHDNRDKYWLDRVGTREMVGYGFNGTPTYVDRDDFPFPAIRWKETTTDIKSLYEKQKGDWRLLTKEEKKALYRSNYCQTFAEFQHPRGDWMEPVCHCLCLCAAESFTPSRKRAQLRRQIDLQMNPIRGLASEWDYEKNDWKRKTWSTPPNPFVKCEDDE